jgi:predicted regulator of Ras-like GTPase activity (Roadblock/LC7/MglB family)/molybdopterin converting factor small subunit
MSIDRGNLEILLNEYLKAVGEGLIAAVIVNKEGLVMASESRGININEEIVGGVSSLIEPVLKRLTKEFSSLDFGTGTFDTEKFRLIFSQVGELAILVSILGPRTMIDPVLPYAYLTSEKIARIFGAREVSPVIPNLYKEERAKVFEQSEEISTELPDKNIKLQDNLEQIEVEKLNNIEPQEIEDISTTSSTIKSKTPPIEPVEKGKKTNVFFISTIGPGEKKQKLLIDNNNVISDIKETVGKLYGLVPANFHLSSAGITLDESLPLKDYNINDGDEILLIPSSTAG